MHEDPAPLESRFPEVIPFTEIRIEGEEHTYRVYEQTDGTEVTKFVYLLDKAPFNEVVSVSGTVDGEPVTFDEGVDYTVIDNDSDGNLDSIDFDTGGGQKPDDNSTFSVTYRAESIISRYIGGFQTEFDDLGDDFNDVVDSHYIDTASGRDLDQVGAIFGVLGKRRGRNDREYRAFLKSIVQSFRGRGTTDGIRFAVAAGLGILPEQVTVNEDFSTNTYTVTVEDYNGHDSETVVDLADLADPSGIAYSGSVKYEGLGDQVYIRADSTVTKEQIVLLGNARLGNQTLGGILT